MSTNTVTFVERRAAKADKPKLPALFRWEPPVSAATLAEWQQELDRVYPPVDRLSRLIIRWEPGDVWQPIQRFLIWQCEDPNTVLVPPFVAEAARGPHPRSLGHYCAPGWCLCEIKKNAWKGSANPLIDRASWELYRDTGLVGRRWWTIQGVKGGHRFTWAMDELEARLSVMYGGPPQTPDPGDLPYAEFDTRVLEKIAQLDLVKQWKDAIEFGVRHVDHLDKAMVRDAQRARAALWDWMDWGMEEAYDAYGKYFRRFLGEEYGRAPVGMKVDDFDYEVVEESFKTIVE